MRSISTCIKKYFHIILGCAYLFSTACTPQPNITKTSDGFIIHLKPVAPGAASAIRLSVIHSKIIRVTAIAGDAFSSTSSLMRDSTSASIAFWSEQHNASEATLKTSSISATVSLKTGEVVFKDSTGNIILQEKVGGGKTLEPAEVDGNPLYRISQVFESPAEEAFYGLGQPQTGLFNYKNKDVDLTQYNGIIAVPFLLSSRKYGLLWDNYSISKFGDNRKQEEISMLKPTSANGSQEGLTAIYSNKANEKLIYTQKQESKIDYTFLSSLQAIPDSFPMDQGKITWDGYFNPDSSGLYKFYLFSSGYIRFWLDGNLLLDTWREGWNPRPEFITRQLEKNKRYPVRLEWIPESSQAFVSLKCLTPNPSLNNKMAISSESAEEIDYYFVYGDTADEIISGYRLLTGKAPVVPKWALGFWQSRERYKTQEEIENTVAEFRKRKIGLDNIVLDWSYWKEDAWGSQEFDSVRFPDPVEMIEKLHNKYQTHFMISVWPKFYEGLDTYKLFDKNNWLYKQNITDRRRDWIGKGYVSTFYDAYNKDARNAFWNLLNTKLFSKGVDAWWLDATEPDILSNASIEKRKALMNPTALGSSTQYFNGYSLQHSKGIYEGQRSINPDQRVFILTRSAYAGMQRYGTAVWSGDIAARFDELERQIPAGINFSLSGLPYWTTDIGGFFVEDKYDKPNPQGKALEEWRELNTRWYQFGAFCPLFRSHGQYPYREIYHIAPEDHPAYRSMLYYNRLRYRLMPYIYSLAGSTYLNDYTLMRGLIMDFASDPHVTNIGDQYMFGPSFLVNPVYKSGALKRKLYLPAGQGWYDFYSGKYFEGGQYLEADAPYERMPLFVKEGSIIPAGPEIQHTNNPDSNTITLYVYTGRDASFQLYEDEGVNNNYEKGDYCNISITYKEAGKTLSIGKCDGDFKGFSRNKIFRIIWVDKNRKAKPDFLTKADTAISYNGNEQSVQMNIKN